MFLRGPLGGPVEELGVFPFDFQALILAPMPKDPTKPESHDGANEKNDKKEAILIHVMIESILTRGIGK